MTAPQYDPAAFAAFLQQQGQAPAAPAPAPAAQFPQHQAGYPVAPQGYPMAPQGYAPQMPQGYAPQQYGQPPAPAPVVNATLHGFFNQPSSGWGPAWSWKDAPLQTTYVGIVARPVTSADVSQQTAPGNGAPLTYRDGRPMLVMRVAMNVQPDQRHPEGKAQWYVQGQARDELARAMAEVGAPAGPPEEGAVIAVTFSGERPNNFGTKSKQYTVRYQRPQGAAQAPAAPAPGAAPTSEVPPAAPTAPAQPAAPVEQTVPQAPAPPAPAAAPAGLPADKAALLAQLTGAGS